MTLIDAMIILCFPLIFAVAITVTSWILGRLL